MERVDISILGREYSLACAPEEKASLMEAVQHVSQLHTMLALVNAGQGVALVPEAARALRQALPGA